MFSGGIAPASRPMLAAIERYTDHLANDPGELYRRWPEDFVSARISFAALIGADEDEVAVTDSTSAGSNLSIEMIEPTAGSNVVFDELSYPSAVFPWMLPARDHVERRFVKARDNVVHLEDLAQAIDDDTIAVSISHVSQETGFRHDLTEVTRLAHEHGALLLVDAIQSVGALRVDVHDTGVDFLSCGAMKWLLGSPGVGFLYVARRHLDRMPPHAGGPGAIPDPRPWGRARVPAQAWRGQVSRRDAEPDRACRDRARASDPCGRRNGRDRRARPGPVGLLHYAAQGARS